METILQPQVAGSGLDYARLLLEDAAAAGLSGILRTPFGELRLADGFVVRVAPALPRALAADLSGVRWTWRRVGLDREGTPNGEIRTPLAGLLLSAAAAADEVAA